MKTKHEEIENRLNTVRAEIFDEFKRLIKLHSITSKTKIEADFIICISPNEYDPIGIEYCEKRDEIIVILKNTNDGSETNEMIRFLNTDDILSLLYWFTDALIVVHDKNGKTITVGMSVMMPEPNETDIYTIGDWIGNVEDILDNGNILVTDSEGDFYEIEPNRVEVDES